MIADGSCDECGGLKQVTKVTEDGVGLFPCPKCRPVSATLSTPSPTGAGIPGAEDFILSVGVFTPTGGSPMGPFEVLKVESKTGHILFGTLPAEILSLVTGKQWIDKHASAASMGFLLATSAVLSSSLGQALDCISRLQKAAHLLRGDQEMLLRRVERLEQTTKKKKKRRAKTATQAKAKRRRR